MNHILYQIFKPILSMFQKNHGEEIDNPSIRIYVNKIENRIKLKIKTGYYLELLTIETMKLLGSTKNKTIKDKNSEYMSRIEIRKVVLVNYNIVDNEYQFSSNKPFGNLLEVSLTDFIFLKTFN